MDLQTGAAVATTWLGIAWIAVKLWYATQKLRREAQVADAEAEKDAAKAEAETARIRDTSPDKDEEKP